MVLSAVWQGSSRYNYYLLELYEKNVQGVDHVHISTVWHKLGNLSKGGDGVRLLKRNEHRLHPLREHTVAMLPHHR